MLEDTKKEKKIDDKFLPSGNFPQQIGVVNSDMGLAIAADEINETTRCGGRKYIRTEDEMYIEEWIIIGEEIWLSRLS